MFAPPKQSQVITKGNDFSCLWCRFEIRVHSYYQNKNHHRTLIIRSLFIYFADVVISNKTFVVNVGVLSYPLKLVSSSRLRRLLVTELLEEFRPASLYIYIGPHWRINYCSCAINFGILNSAKTFILNMVTEVVWFNTVCYNCSSDFRSSVL